MLNESQTLDMFDDEMARPAVQRQDTFPSEREIRESAFGPIESSYTDVYEQANDRANQDFAESVGLVGARRDNALIEFGQGFAGGMSQYIGSAVKTGVELGVVNPRTLDRIEQWQDVHQQYQVYEGAKPWSSWAAFAGYAGEGTGQFLPTIAVGGVFGKVGAAFNSARKMASSAVTVSLMAQHQGEQIRFYREEVGMPKMQAAFLGTLSGAMMTALDKMFGLEQRLTTYTANGFTLNALKRAGESAAIKQALDVASKEALLAKAIGKTRPYLVTLREMGIQVGGEGFTEVGQLFFDDMRDRYFLDKPMHSLEDYFDTFAAVVPSTLMFATFGSYRKFRNEQMVNELLAPLDKDTVNRSISTFGNEQMMEFDGALGTLRDNFLKIAGQRNKVTENEARAAADIIGGMALRSALMIDRNDGQHVNPMEFIENFQTAIANRELTAGEILSLNQMPKDRALDFLYEKGIIDGVDSVRKKSDAEDAVFLQQAIRDGLVIKTAVDVLDSATEERVRNAWSRMEERPMSTPAEEGVEPAPLDLEMVDETEVNQLRVRNQPTTAKAEGAIVIEDRYISKEARMRALTNPFVFRAGAQFYSLRLLDDGNYGLVPTEAMTDVEREAARRERINDANKAREESILMVRDEGAASMPEGATKMELKMRNNRIVVDPEGNVETRFAAETANALKAQEESKALDMIEDRRKEPIKSLQDIPSPTPRQGQGVYDVQYSEQDGGKPEGLYVRSANVAVFFENATAATILHEYFHHMQNVGLVPPRLQTALDNSFGDIEDPNRRNEVEAEAFTRWVVNGELPDGSDPNLQRAFEYMQSVGATYYSDIQQRWALPDAVKTELDGIFQAEPISENTPIAQAALAALENDKAVDWMANRRPEIRGFHIAMKNAADGMGIDRDRVRQILKDSGMKAYIYAKDDPSKQQREDMSNDEMSAAVEQLAQMNTSYRPLRRISEKAKQRLADLSEEQHMKNVEEALASLNKLPNKQHNRDDIFGGRDKVRDLWRRVKRFSAKALIKTSTHWNVAKVLDGGKDGPFTRLVANRIAAGEDNMGEVLNDVEQVMLRAYEAIGGRESAASPTDLARPVEVGDVTLYASKVLYIYLVSEGGNPDSVWAKNLVARNEEVTPDVIRDSKRYIESEDGKDLRNYATVFKAVMKHLHPLLDQTAKDIGKDGVGNLGDWYVPFISEDRFEATKEWDDLLSHVTPTADIDTRRGVRAPEQTKSRADIGRETSELMRLQKLQERGRLNMNIDEILSRYVHTSANYIGKARDVKASLMLLEDPRIKEAARAKFGENDWRGALRDMVTREMYPSGRQTRLGSGERSLAFVRSASTLSMLGYRVTSGLRQFPSIGVGWAAYARPRDIIRSLGIAYQGLAHGDGWRKFSKIAGREPLKGMEAYDEMVSDHPSLRYRSYIPEHRDMQALGGVWATLDRSNPIKLKSKGFIQKFMQHSMDHIRYIDAVVVASVYKSAKDSRLDQLQDKVLRGEIAQDEANTQAADYALRVIDKTQNPSNMSQRALMQTENEFMKMLNPFAGQRFINLNYYIYDVALPILDGIKNAQGIAGKSQAAIKGIFDHRRELSYSWLVPALMFGVIGRRRLPQDDEEVLVDILAYPFTSVPVIGGVLESWVTGKFQSYSYDPTMLGNLARSTKNTAEAVYRGATGEGVDWNDATQARRLLAVIANTPDYPMQVIQNFAESMFSDDPDKKKTILDIFGMAVEDRKPDDMSESDYKALRKLMELD